MLGLAEQTSPNSIQQMLLAKSLAALGSPEQAARLVTPKLSAFGPVSSSGSITVTGDNAPGALMRHAQVSLKDVSLSIPAYGLDAKGVWQDIAVAGANAPLDITLTCIHCDAMIGALGDYALRVDRALQAAQPGRPPVVTAPLIDGFRRFFHEVAESSSAANTSLNRKKDGSDLVYRLSYKRETGFTVNGKSLLQIFGLFGTTLAPQLQQTGKVNAVPTPSANAPLSAAPAAMTPIPAPPAPCAKAGCSKDGLQ
jgi:hypothetical protein